MAGAFVLHVQCAWRVELGDRIHVGQADLSEPATGIEWTENWTWDDGTLQDERLRELLDLEGARSRRTFVVEEVRGLPHAGAWIRLSDGCAITLFADGAGEECWRLLGREMADHFVVRGGLIETIDDETVE